MGRSKLVTRGTHRAVTAEDTWQWIKPKLAGAGITRVADITGLDDIGIPVFQAIRPNARTLSVSQGKGITSDLARVSAAMEAIEFWHAEEMNAPSVSATVGEMSACLPYAVTDLPARSRNLIAETTRLQWIKATVIGGDDEVWVPRDFVHLDQSRLEWACPLFYTTSNGLASGNIRDEALLHGMYEILERQAVADAADDGHGRKVDLSTVTGDCAALLERFAAAEVSVRVRDLGDAIGLACYSALIWSRSLPLRCAGYGCHLDADVALSRALTEAAQSRLSLIAGSRDDIADEPYSWVTSRAVLSDPFADDRPDVAFSQTHDAADDFDTDVETVARLLGKRATGPAVWVDLTRREVGIPVVKVIAPGLDICRDR